MKSWRTKKVRVDTLGDTGIWALDKRIFGIGGGTSTSTTDLREFHQTKVSKDPRPVQIGDVVAVYNESKRHGEWRFAVIESIIKGNDNVVKGANIRVIAKGKPLRMSRPIQKLYPIEVQTEIQP